MRMTNSAILAGFLTIGGMAGIDLPSAHAQMAMSGGGRSLGGYGASTITSYYGGGGGYLPYNGAGSGILPASGGVGVMSGQPAPRMIPQSPVGGSSMVAATPIGGISAAGGMGPGMDPRGGRGMGARSPRRAYAPLLPGGGMTGGMGGTRSGGMGGGRSAAGPGLGSPFRMPMEFGGGGSSSMGMP